jgi:ferredoxin-nitrate reductase
MDGNTRLCTATAATAMRESFGCDGQPGSYRDIVSRSNFSPGALSISNSPLTSQDFADTIFLVGHNMAATQTVLWTRILDRLEGPNPPTIIAMDPRETPVGHAAKSSGGVMLGLKTGTNLALLNGLLRIILKNPAWYDKEYIGEFFIGFFSISRGDSLAGLTVWLPYRQPYRRN